MDPFEQVYKRSEKKIYRYLLSLCRDSDLAEELTAETFYRAYLHMDQFEERSSVDTWLCEIAKNTWLETVRKQKRQIKLTEDAPEDTDRPFWIAMEERDTALEIHRALHELPEPYREVFSLRVLGELKFSDIAAIFGKSESWAKMTFYRGKSKLLTILEEGTL